MKARPDRTPVARRRVPAQHQADRDQGQHRWLCAVERARVHPAAQPGVIALARQRLAGRNQGGDGLQPAA